MNTELNEEKLIKLAKDGDKEAFANLIEKYKRMILSIAFCTAQNEHDAADMAQEVFVKLYRNINKFEGKSKFSTWVYRVAQNTCIDELKRIKRMMRLSSENEKTLGELEEQDPLTIPEEQLIKNEFNSFVQLLLKELSPLYQEILTLRYIDGLSYNEISEKLCCSTGTVKSRLYRGKRNMKKIIDEKIKNFMIII